ncbi:MAG: hypothetical protein ACKOJF_10940 [Planctomycetaceae bacterium]
MPAPRVPPLTVAAPRGDGLFGPLGWLAVAWLGLFTTVFFSARLANNPAQDRVSLLLLAPERLQAPFFPPSEQARVLSFGNLADRGDLLLVAGLLWFAAWGWGRCLLAVARVRQEDLTPAERHWLAAGCGIVLISLATLVAGLLGVLQTPIFRLTALLGGVAGLVTCWPRRLAHPRNGAQPSLVGVPQDSPAGEGTRGANVANHAGPAPGSPLEAQSTTSPGGAFEESGNDRQATFPKVTVAGSAGWRPVAGPSLGNDDRVAWGGVACWLLAMAPFVAVQVLGALLPSSDFDVNEYHFGGPKEWFQAGQIHWLPHNVYTSFPFATEMLTLAGMVLHGDWYRGAVAGKTELCGLGLLTGAGLYFAGRRWFDRPTGAWAALIWLSQPWTYRIGTIAYAEGGLCAAVAVGLWVLSLHSTTGGARVEPVDQPQGSAARARAAWLRAPWFGLGLCAGWGMACKYPGLISAVMPLGVACGWLAWRDARRARGAGPLQAGPESRIQAGHSQAGHSPGSGSPRRAGGADHATPRASSGTTAVAQVAWALAWFGAGVVAVVGPWLLKNLWETGNPVYPLGWTVFGGADWDAELNRRWRAAHSSSEFSLASVWNLASDILWRNDWVSPAVGALLPVALLASAKRGVAWRLAGYVLWLFASTWGLTHRLDRFWVPLLPVAALLAGRGAMVLFETWGRPGVPLGNLPRLPQLARGLLTVCAGVVWLYCLVLNVSPLGGNNAYLMKFTDAAQTVASLTAPELVELNDRLPAGSRVLAVGDAEMFEARFAVAYNTVFDHCLLEQWLADPESPPGTADRPWRPTAELRAELTRRGITHIYVNWLEILRYRSPGNYGYTPFVHPGRFEELRERGVLGSGWNIPSARLPLDRLDPGRRSIVEEWGHRPVVRSGGEEQLVTFEVFPVLP